MARPTVTVDDEVTIDDGSDTLVIGSTSDIVALLGGETYTLAYGDKQAQAAWLDTDDDGQLTVDVREALEGMPFTDEFVTDLADRDGDERAEFFADTVTTIWDGKGDPDDADLPDSLTDN
jgi:hypothetical protein